MSEKSICDSCKLDMLALETITCSGNQEIKFPNDKILPTLDFVDFLDEARCRDCNVQPGGKHHPGCALEVCPQCNGQLISCGCLDEFDALNRVFNLT
jgi:hypothetical protein